MTGTKRITDLTDYTSVLPYASELFGVYQPLIGWRSRRQLRRMRAGTLLERQTRLFDLSRHFAGRALLDFNADFQLESARIRVGTPAGPRARASSGSLLLSSVAEQLQENGDVPGDDLWRDLVLSLIHI